MISMSCVWYNCINVYAHEVFGLYLDMYPTLLVSMMLMLLTADNTLCTLCKWCMYIHILILHATHNFTICVLWFRATYWLFFIPLLTYFSLITILQLYVNFGDCLSCNSVWSLWAVQELQSVALMLCRMAFHLSSKAVASHLD